MKTRKKLQMIKLLLAWFSKYGFKINFIEKLYNQNVPKIPHGMLETEIITQEVKKLLNKGVIGDASRKHMILDPRKRKMVLLELF